MEELDLAQSEVNFATLIETEELTENPKEYDATKCRKSSVLSKDLKTVQFNIRANGCERQKRQ